jgi:hypothetical protein
MGLAVELRRVAVEGCRDGKARYCSDWDGIFCDGWSNRK